MIDTYIMIDTIHRYHTKLLMSFLSSISTTTRQLRTHERVAACDNEPTADRQGVAGHRILNESKQHSLSILVSSRRVATNISSSTKMNLDEAHVAYALIDQSWGLPPLDDDDEYSPYSIRPPSSAETDPSAVNGTSAVSLTTVDQWYEYYAVRTPSAGFLTRQDDEMEEQVEKEKKGRQGWFSRLLFGKGREEGNKQTELEQVDETALQTDEDMPVKLTLDTAAINHEALSFHRFHLTSERRALVTANDSKQYQGHSVVLPIRISVGWDEHERISGLQSTQTHLCIVGYGQIAEFPSLPESSFASLQQHPDNTNVSVNQNINPAKISLTSDHNELLSFTTKLDKDEPKPLYDLRHCRAASIGPDCLVISWGLGGDGSFVFYRRLKQKRAKRVGFEEQPTIGWVAVAYATPSDSVIEAALHKMTPDPCLGEKYEHRAQEHNIGRLYELGSLRVADLVPLIFNNMPESGISSTAALAISRLGGFIELLPLPSWLWLDEMTAPPRKLVDLAAMCKVTAFSTSIYHSDVMALDAYHTLVGMNTCFVLTACGRPTLTESPDANENIELDEAYSRGSALSFWSIARVYANGQKGSVFDLGVKCIQRCYLDNLGPKASVFISGSVVDHWSNRVQIPTNGSGSNKKQRCEPSLLSNITTSAPILSLRFTPSRLPASANHGGVLLAVLDYNGGVTVLDCTQCIRSIEQIIANDPLLNESNVLVSYTEIVPLASREISIPIQSNLGSVSLSRACQIEWWHPPSPFATHVDSSYPNEKQCLVDTSSLGTFHLAINSTVMQKNNFGLLNMIRLQKWILVANDHVESVEPSDVFFIPAGSSASMLLPMRYETSQETLSLVRVGASPRPLSVCGIRKFDDPTEIIAVLLNQSDPAKALDVARSFGGAQHFGSAIMNKCQIQLWEEQRNTEALTLIADHDYVIREAVCLDQRFSNVDYNSAHTVQMKDIIHVYSDALKRLGELQSDGDAQRQEWLSNSAFQLRKSLRLAGTFEVLIQHFGDSKLLNETFDIDHLSRRFLNGFRHCQLFDVATSAASRGDINALTILLTRHPISTSSRMKLLELIPLHVDISSYEHLLPCILDDVQQNSLFLPKSQVGIPRQFLNSLEMMMFLAGSNTLTVVANEADGDFIVKHYEDNYHDMDDKSINLPLSKEEVACWYLKMCFTIHNRTQNISVVKMLGELALLRLGFISFAEDGRYTLSGLENLDETGGESFRKLIYLHYATKLLDCIAGDKMKDCALVSSTSIHLSAQAELRQSIVDLCSMDASSIVSFILESGGSSSNSSLLETHIAPFLSGGKCLTPTQNGVITCNAKSEKLHYCAVVEFCLEKLRQSKNRKRKITSENAIDPVDWGLKLQQALSVCSIFASFVGLKEWREDELVSFASEVFNCTVKIVGDDWNLVMNKLIDHLWAIFETVPVSSSSSLKNQTIRLRLRLMMIQLCCKWSEHQPISKSVRSYVLSDTQNEDSEEEKLKVCTAYFDLIVALARGFCGCYIGENGHGRSLLLDFISDVDEFDRVYFGPHANESGGVGTILLPLLLKNKLFSILHDLLCIRPGWFCQDQTRAILLSYIRTPDHKNTHSIQSCTNALSSLFPELTLELEAHRRLSDAKLFVLNEMGVDAQLIDPLFYDQLSKSPVSSIKVFLSSYPESLLIGCGFWSDHIGSEKACVDASSYFSSQINAVLNQTTFDESLHILPPMPGALVMRLSNILGSLSSFDVLMIKQLMVKGVLELGLVPAAIAICWSMLCDAAFSEAKQDLTAELKWTAQYWFVVQQCVISSITAPRFNCFRIKKELCSQSLHLFGADGAPFRTALLNAFLSLDYDELPPQQERHKSNHIESTPNSELLVFKAVEIVARRAKDFVEQTESLSTIEKNPFFSMNLDFNEIHQASSIDVSMLMSTLRSNPKGNSSNEHVLNDLSQAFFSWVVKHTFGKTSQSTVSATRTRLVIELGASCLAELTDKETASSIIGMALEEFKANHISSISQISKSAGASIKPDPALAQRLHERGYGWNAARRACIMTNNQGYSEALGWAVSHFQDDDFDSPLYIVHDESDFFFRQEVTSLVHDLLQSIKARYDNNNSYLGVKTVPLEAADAVDAHSRVSLQLSDQLSRDRGNDALVFKTSSTFAPSQKPVAPALPPSGKVFSTEKAGKVAKLTQPNTNMHTPRIQTGDYAVTSPQSNFLETPTNASTCNCSTIPPNSAESVSSIEGSLGSRASIQKQINLGRKVLGTTKISAEDRKKLAAEGKRLLEAARKRNKGVVAPPASIVTKGIPMP